MFIDGIGMKLSEIYKKINKPLFGADFSFDNIDRDTVAIFQNGRWKIINGG